ncbi:hypothetical protein GCM10009789_68030 [Kribbella sancticallisti]|uniref:Adhesin domain-containing protein n=1 Tax=Kribbella sancticallisti TaxID=460087 RepID=A0ABP4Q8T2_9ACTN
MSDQSNDYDARVKDILDRVAKGHLTSDEAATLIAAITKSPTPTATDPAATVSATVDAPAAEVADEGPAAAAADSGTADVPSPSVWAEVVDSPDASPSPTPKHAGPSTTATEEEAPTASIPDAADAADAVASTGEGSVVDDEAEEVETEHSNVPVPSGVQRVTIRAIGRRVRLIGEPAVSGVAVDGPHVIKRDGDTLAISSEGDMGVSIDGFSMLRNPTNLKSHVNGLAKELSIRVNPMLNVEIEVTGGSVSAERLPGLTRVRVTAGTAKVTDVDGPIDLLVQAGSASLDAQITKGRSRVRVESGAATVNLRRGSDVRVHTESQLGRVTWTGAVSGQSKDVEIGRGRAALDVEVLVGTAQIASD